MLLWGSKWESENILSFIDFFINFF
ncbi:hypothetical protein J2Y60_001339 [Arcicella sp. BE140]|nr:hypothetical protein [Arcicella sp. BE51]MDR6811150.1 hypothetical protein [Arcicella sp. BE140]MDR6822500.1 hypothetical protein [Arcicella sp. BE139]